MNLLPSIIRTGVPLVVGFIASWLAALGITVDDDQRAVLVSLFGSVVGALYYVVARVLERRFPQLTWLLGSAVQPAAYQPAAVGLVGAPASDVSDAMEAALNARLADAPLADPPLLTHGQHEAPENPGA